MPTVTREGMSRSNSQSVLDRITPVSNVSSTGIKLCVYGRGKTGKTRLASTFPKPMLLIGTEDGTKSVSDVVGLDFVRLLSSGEVLDLSKMLKEGKYKSVALDTAGGLQDLILKEVLGLDELPPQKTWGLAQQDHWMAVSMQFKEHIDSLMNLADTKGIHVVIIAHERNFGDESGGGSDVMIPTVGAALTPKVANWLNTRCDYVTQAFLRQKVEKVKTVIEGKTIITKKIVDGVDYCLRTGEHPIFSTGFRLPVGRVLPDVMINADYDKLSKLIRGDK